jgi:F0F1-type ATP synthase assembly protein I
VGWRFLLGAQGWGWILEHGIKSGPVIVLLVFVLVGVGFIAGALLRRQHGYA